MGKKGPPYKHPGDAEWIVVLKPPHIQEKDRIDYSPLEYWLRAISGDQRAARFIYEIQGPPYVAVIVELPSPQELYFPKAAYGLHSLRFGLKRRPWFNHQDGETIILPYNFEKVGHPEDTRKISPMQSGPCDNEWEKFDLTIPYPPPQPFDFGRVPHKVRMFCRPVPDATPPPPDSMEIERYPTPPAQERQRVHNFHQPSPPRSEQPLFIPEDDSAKLKIKNLDPYQEEESISSFLRSDSSTIDSMGWGVKPEPRPISVAEGSARLNTNEGHRESNALLSRGNSRLTADSDELGNNPLSVKHEFANQDDTESQRIHELLQAANRSQSPSVDDRLSVKRELEKQDGASAQKMFKLLNAVSRGQSAHVDGPSGSTVKRDIETQATERREYNPSRNDRSGPQPPRYPAQDRYRNADINNGDGYRSALPPNPNTNSWRDRDERGGRERERERERDDRNWRGGERSREPSITGGDRDRKRTFAHPDGRSDRGSGDRREYPDKRSRANYR